MTHPTEHDLHRFHDGELPPAERGRVAAHMALCDACAAVLASLRAIGEQVRAAPLPVATAMMLDRWKRVAQERAVRRLAGWMTAAASVVLVVSSYVASSGSARAMPTTSDWEVAVVGIDVGTTDQPLLEQPFDHQVTAAWIATDLAAGGRP